MFVEVEAELKQCLHDEELAQGCTVSVFAGMQELGLLT